jgi:hypothetical protein
VDLQALLDKAIEFEFRATPRLRVVLRGRDRSGNRLWAVTDGRLGIVTRDLEWTIEPPPEERSAAFLQATRFSLEDACEIALEIVELEATAVAAAR